MVLFEFDKLIKKKYLNYCRKNKSDDVELMNFDQYKKNGIIQLTKIFKFYFGGISENYIINTLLNVDKVKILLSCIDSVFSLGNITSILVYHQIKSIESNKYYILLLGTHERFRKFGYGKVILDEFGDLIKSTKSYKNKNCKILLKSLESSLKFYLDYGFVLTSLQSNRLFYKYENNDELKNNQEKILEYIVE